MGGYGKFTAGYNAGSLINIGVFGKNSHVFFDTKDGVKLWLPQATVFFHSLGLPFEPVK